MRQGFLGPFLGNSGGFARREPILGGFGWYWADFGGFGGFGLRVWADSRPSLGPLSAQRVLLDTAFIPTDRMLLCA